jgi:hypothetical protein
MTTAIVNKDGNEGLSVGLTTLESLDASEIVSLAKKVRHEHLGSFLQLLKSTWNWFDETINPGLKFLLYIAVTLLAGTMLGMVISYFMGL